MLSAEYVKKLDGDEECVRALTWLAERAKPYPSGGFTPPLRGSKKVEKPRPFVAMTMRVGRIKRLEAGSKITRLDVTGGTSTSSSPSDPSAIAAWMAKTLLTSKMAGTYIVTSGTKRRVLDIWLESIGPSLLSLGYCLQPCVTSGGISFVTIRRGKRSWQLVYYETAFGIQPFYGADRAGDAATAREGSETLVRGLYRATSAAAAFLLETFGVAFRLTSGMTAMACARRFIPEGMEKWRPTPLHVALERIGIGYRGGITYAQRYRGPSWRVDVNRQYTHALRSALPLRTAFGRYVSSEVTPHGIFVCRVQLRHPIPYPVGIWRGPEIGFEYGPLSGDAVVCVLHTSEFPGLQAHGAEITPSYGYVYTSTFTLAGYVERLQRVIDLCGKESWQGRLTKPLGNFLYGKLAQKAVRMELLFSDAPPPAEWHPFFDDKGKGYDNVWERTVTRYTAGQHVDIAGTITGAARSQTALTWGYLSALGYRVVRCHTDSLTLDSDPTGAIHLSTDTIGRWRVESVDNDSIIVGPNAYADDDGAHVAGVTAPSFEMLERLYDGHVVYQTQDVMLPRFAWTRETRQRTREYRPAKTAL